jgi:POT family proton-dependent oligopeptide transporter
MRSQDGELFGHPKGLYVLFFTEMWERFSYYGMRALLIYYMTKYLLLSQGQASQVYGLYTGFVYLTPFFGGMLADRVWGQLKTVIVGGVLMAIGHFLMAFEKLFYPALVFLVLGNGAFKPNISTQVGSLYQPGDARRDRAFNIFYVGINLGAFLSPLVCGTLGEVYGWHWGFGFAGVGMVIGLLIYIWGQRYFPPECAVRRPAADGRTGGGALTADEKGRVWLLIFMCMFSAVFYMAYEQQGNTMALWADEDTDRHIFGWEMPATWFQSFNPLFIFLLTPLVTSLWAWQARRGREPDAVVKMAVGCMLLGLSFLVLMPAAAMYDVDGTPVNMLWTIGSIFILTIGELYLSPVGLSLFTKLSPPRMASMMMGVWFMSSFAGNFLAGYIGTFWDVLPKDKFFLLLAVIAFAAGAGILAYRRLAGSAARCA